MRRARSQVSPLILVLVVALGIGLPVHADDGLRQRARTVLGERPADPAVSAAHGRLLVAYADSLEADGAITLAARALEVAGILAFQRAELDTALAHWRRGVDLARAHDDTRAEGSLLNALAIGHTVRGDVESALPVYDRSLELREATADSVGLSRTWGNLANAYTNAYRLSEALEATVEEERWLAVVDNPMGRVANAARRASILRAMERPREALLWADRAVELAPEVSGHDSLRARTVAHMRRGSILVDLGRHAEALEALDTASRAAEEQGDRYLGLFLRQLRGLALLGAGRHEEALVLVDEALPEVRAAGHRGLETVLLRLRGHALFETGRVDEALTSLERARILFEERREEMSDPRSRSGVFLASGEIYASLARGHLAVGDTARAFSTVERGRAPSFREETGDGGISLAHIQSSLRAQRAALVLFNDPRFDPLVAFVLDGEGLRAVALGEIDELAEDARATLRLLAGGVDLEALEPSLRRMSRRVSAPVLSAVPSTVLRFYVVPPSFLAGFPLGLLSDGEGKRWADRAPINYLPNAGALPTLEERRPRGTEVMAFADPVLPARSSASGRLPVDPRRGVARVPLPEARTEARLLTRDPAALRLGAAATAAAFRSPAASSAAVLHVATHAMVDPVDGRRSALLLAGDDPEGIEAVDAEQIRARSWNGDLVVLSGCTTFGEHRVLGEGWFGLPRSFLGGGARSVLSTLWDVDDRGARQLVEAYYDGLRRGLDRDVALQRAKARARAAGLPPRDWAGFVLTGQGAGPVEALRAGIARNGGDGSAKSVGRWALAVLVVLGLRGLLTRGSDAGRSVRR